MSGIGSVQATWGMEGAADYGAGLYDGSQVVWEQCSRPGMSGMARQPARLKELVPPHQDSQ